MAGGNGLSAFGFFEFKFCPIMQNSKQKCTNSIRKHTKMMFFYFFWQKVQVLDPSCLAIGDETGASGPSPGGPGGGGTPKPDLKRFIKCFGSKGNIVL